MTPLQEFLIACQNDGKDPLATITAEKGIKTYRHKSLPLIGFAYDQIASPKTDPVVRWARGTVLEEGSWNLIAQSMPRFFNQGENMAEWNAFDWNNFVATEKLDGSLCIIYHYKDQLMVNTSGSFDSNIASHPITFREAFLACTDVSKLDKSLTYIFEFCSTLNMVVRKYNQPIARLITVFNGSQELSHEDSDAEAVKAGLVRVPTVPMKTMADLKDHLMAKESGDPTYEGVVIRDSNNTRYKCKTKTYIGFHHMNDDGQVGSYKRILPFVMAGECDEVKIYFPELIEKIDRAKKKVDDAYNRLSALWEESKDIVDQKEFALKIKYDPMKSVLFTMKKLGRTSQADLRKTWREHDELILKTLLRE